MRTREREVKQCQLDIHLKYYALTSEPAKVIAPTGGQLRLLRISDRRPSSACVAAHASGSFYLILCGFMPEASLKPGMLFKKGQRLGILTTGQRLHVCLLQRTAEGSLVRLPLQRWFEGE